MTIEQPSTHDLINQNDILLNNSGRKAVLQATVRSVFNIQIIYDGSSLAMSTLPLLDRFYAIMASDRPPLNR